MTDSERFDIISEMRVIKARFEDFMNRTDEFRHSIYSKLENMECKLTNLPCSERKGIYSNILNQLKILWTLILLAIGAIVSEWFKK